MLQTAVVLNYVTKKRHELSIEGDRLLRGTITIVPLKLRQEVLNELHKGHCGIVK